MKKEREVCPGCGIQLSLFGSPEVCNYCGNPFNEWDTQQNFVIHKKIGYGSENDGDEVQLQLCCTCFDKIIKECDVSPIIGG